MTVNWHRLMCIVFIIAILFLTGLYRLKIETNILGFLPKDDPVLSDASSFFENHFIQDQLIIDVSHEKDDLDILVKCGKLVEEKLKQSGLFKNVGMQDMQNLIPALSFYISDNLPVMFSANELNNTIKPLLTPESIKKRLTEIKTRLLNLSGIGQAEFISKDPLGFRNLIMAKLAYLSPSQNVRIYKGQLISSDGKHLLVIAKTKTSSTDTAFARKVAELIKTLSKQIIQDYSKLGYQVKLTPAGAYRAALDNEVIIRRDVTKAILFATFGVMLLLIVAFPRPYLGLLSLLPAIAGIMVALFIFSLMHKSVSLMVLGFGGAIISISVDHGIAYLLFLDQPQTTYGKDASREVWAIGLLAALTTAGAFTALNMSGFPILKQLGQFTALGISLSFIFVHTVFPMIFPKMPPARPKTLVLQKIVDRFARVGKKGAYGALIFFFVMLFFAKPEFNVSLTSMNTVSKETVAADDLITNVWHMATNKIYIMIDGGSIQELQKKGDRLLEMINKDRLSGTLSPVFVSSIFFPGEDRRKQNYASWKNFWSINRIKDLEKTMETFSVELGFTKDAFEPFYKMLSPDSYIPKYCAIPENFFDMMGITVSPDNKTWVQVCSLTAGPTYNADEFFARYSSLGKLFDPNFFSKKLGALLFSIFVKMLVVIGVGVTILLLMFFLDVTLTLISLLPIIFALICTLGTLKLIGHSLDIPGIMLSIIVFGMGIDYSLFFTRSYQRYGDADHPNFGLIRLAVFMASASTIIGFGVLCSAEHSLLKSAGVTSLISISYALIGAFIILPPVLDYRFKPRTVDNLASNNIKNRVMRRYRNLEPYPRLFARFKMLFDPMFLELPRLLKNSIENVTIVDIGCGYGVPACWLLESYPEATIYGIDPNHQRTRIASLAVGKRGVITNGFAPEIPIVSKPVDLVMMVDILHYLKDNDLKLTLRNLYNNLRRGGHLIIRAPILPKRYFPWLWWVENFKLRLSGTPSYYRTIEEIKTIIMQTGFTIEQTESSGSKEELVWFVVRSRS
jgi:predicted exporter/ubiquinone/menaquinone biosynthesis C-methylase UbiE